MHSQWKNALAAILLGAAGLTAHAADYPSEGPVRIVIGFTPGNVIDTTARIVAEALTARLKQTFIVDNRSGANGMIAARAVAQAKPDGYTLLVSNSSSITVNQFLFKDTQFDSTRDLSPITMMISVPFVLVINPDNPKMKGITDLKSLVEYARQHPGALSYGSAGTGNLMHLASAQLATASGVNMVHVPYRGAGPAEQALMSKDIDFVFDTLSSVSYVKSGKFKALAVSTAQRWYDLPDVPTVAEQGYPGFDIGFWIGLLGPASMPPDIVNLLNREVAEAIRDPKVKERLLQQGRPEGISVEEFKKKIATEIKENAELIKTANIHVE